MKRPEGTKLEEKKGGITFKGQELFREKESGKGGRTAAGDLFQCQTPGKKEWMEFRKRKRRNERKRNQMDPTQTNLMERREGEPTDMNNKKPVKPTENVVGQNLKIKINWVWCPVLMCHHSYFWRCCMRILRTDLQ